MSVIDRVQIFSGRIDRQPAEPVLLIAAVEGKGIRHLVSGEIDGDDAVIKKSGTRRVAVGREHQPRAASMSAGMRWIRSFFLSASTTTTWWGQVAR